MRTGLALAMSALVAVVFTGGPQARAERLRLPKIASAVTVKECGACHMVYAPQMLPQRSWTAIMGGLDSHFGESAKLAEPARGEIEAYLLANAADSPTSRDFTYLMRRVKPELSPARITEMPWWVRAHHEVSVSNLKTTKIKSAGNCIGCHVGSDKTMVFNEPGE
jgi:hypothetical protein